MKTISAALQAHLSSNPTTLAYLWKVKRKDGTILGFTSHDRDITYDAGDGDGAVTYAAKTGFAGTAAENKTDLSIDNMEATAFLDSSAITEADLRAHKYDNADIQIRVVNWNDLTMGDLYWRRGTLGIVKIKNGQFTAELRGLASKLSSPLTRTYGPLCRATFGSGLNGIDMNSKWLCKIDVTLWRQPGFVSVAPTAPDALTVKGGTPASPASITMVGSATPTALVPGNWFNDGIITFTSGVLNGQSFEIKTSTNYSGGMGATLYLPLPALPALNDTFTIEPGCNKTEFDCQGKYSNIANFRGENVMPGQDAIFDYPDQAPLQ